MCGIVGYIGHQKASPILINGLLRLEYRGYDSAGIAVIEKDGISILKDKGKVNNLYNLDGIDKLEGTNGIAHTRWATHGKPSKINSHPHMDESNTFAVVHNGIIENFSELRKFLEDNNVKFISDTDTEVIPNLINYYYSKEVSRDIFSFLHAVKVACNELKGSFALEILCKDFPDNMIVVRKDSPLVIGKGVGENFIASDIPAILSFTKDFYLLNDFEYALLSRNDIKFFDNDLTEINLDTKTIEWNMEAAEKNGYDDFMLKEIYEQPTSIRETIGSTLNEDKVSFPDLNISKEYLHSLNRIYIIACGTAMHVGLATKNIFEQLCKIPVEVEVASEFRYKNPLVDSKTLCIYISQSGETADTIAALKLAKSKGAKTLAISNVIGSSITREADYTIYTHAGPEIAVASTKAYTSQVVLTTILAIYFSEILGTADTTLIDTLKKEILELPKKVDEVLTDTSAIKDFANKIYKEKDIFFIGRGLDYAITMEASLKLKEISYIHSEAYAAGELKHGTIALIENGITVISSITNPDLAHKTISNIQEVITRGAKTLVVTNQDLEGHSFDGVIRIPEVNPMLAPVVAIVPMQLLAYYVSKAKGLDVDKPRNLAKSVTVE